MWPVAAYDVDGGYGRGRGRGVVHSLGRDVVVLGDDSRAAARKKLYAPHGCMLRPSPERCSREEIESRRLQLRMAP